MKEKFHDPVLLNEFLKYSQSKSKNPTLWDGTLGLAGHSLAWQKKYPQGKIKASDIDEEMILQAKKRIKEESVDGFFEIKKAYYSELPFAEQKFDTIFLDLGISSLHYDFFHRGFSYRFDEVLDMRLNTQEGISVSEWLKTADVNLIKKIIYTYGEEKKAPFIAKAIHKHFLSNDEMTTFQLKEICQKVYSRDTKRHPYIKTFMAFRLFINQELEHLKNSIAQLPFLLKKNGRLIIISFHSLEDRIIKKQFKALTQVKDNSIFAKSNFKESQFKILTKKPIMATEEEVQLNQRSRTAKMRILERINIKEYE